MPPHRRRDLTSIAWAVPALLYTLSVSLAMYNRHWGNSPSNMIQIHLKRLLAERKMTMADLSYSARINKNTVSDICHGRIQGIRLDTIDRICRSLECGVGELFTYSPEDPEEFGELDQLE